MRKYNLGYLVGTVLVMAIINSCGGNGKLQPAQEEQQSQFITIKGKIVITGVDDFSSVVVTAERTDENVTASVQEMLVVRNTGTGNDQKVYTTVTDKDGIYEFNRLPLGKYSISAHRQDILASVPKIVEAVTKEIIMLNFELVVTSSISGKVTLGGEDSNNGGIVVFIPGTSYAAYSDDMGNYTISNVPLGVYSLTFAKENYKWKSIANVEVKVGQKTIVETVSLEEISFQEIRIECNSLSDCNDDNRYTDDSCVKPGTVKSYCLHQSVICFDITDCNDNNKNTYDVCNNAGKPTASCSYNIIACFSSIDCDDNDQYTYDICSDSGTITASCSHKTIACLADKDCSDNNSITLDECIEPGKPSSFCRNTNSFPLSITLNPPTNVATSSLTLSWTKNSDIDFAFYKIYRDIKPSISQASMLHTIIPLPETTSVTILGLDMNTNYYFKVYVCDTAGQCTGSNEIKGTTLLQGTYVSGILWNNTIWTKLNSPYIVNDNLHIPSNIILTIEPGVTIVFNGAYEILVKGAVIANGTASESITFTTTENSRTSGTFLHFVDTNLTNSQISYVKMENSYTAIQIGNTTDNDSTQNNTGILKTSYMEIKNTNVQIKGNYTTSPTLAFYNATINSAKISIFDSSLIEIIDTTISDATIVQQLYSIGRGIRIVNSTISNTKFENGGGTPNIKMVNSTIINSPADNLSYAKIIQSQLINSPINIYGLTFETSIEYSTITYNGTYGIHCMICAINHSKIIGDGRGTGIEIFRGAISNAEIKNASTGIKMISVSGNPNGILSISNTNFINNTVYNIENRTTSTVNATYNYWNTVNTDEISTKIYDYYDNINFGKVSYVPISSIPQEISGGTRDDIMPPIIVGTVPSSSMFIFPTITTMAITFSEEMNTTLIPSVYVTLTNVVGGLTLLSNVNSIEKGTISWSSDKKTISFNLTEPIQLSRGSKYQFTLKFNPAEFKDLSGAEMDITNSILPLGWMKDTNSITGSFTTAN